MARKMPPPSPRLGYRDLQLAPSSSSRVSNDNWDFLRAKFNDILNGIESRNFEELYKKAYSMVIDRRAAELYQGVRRVITEHVQGWARKFQTLPMEDGLDGPFLLRVGQKWYKFMEMMENFRAILIYSERVYENSIGAESLIVFGWKTFRLELLENTAIKKRLAMEIKQNATMRETDQPSNVNKKGLSDVPFAQSELFSTDTILEVMSFLPNINVGLKCALAARQLASLSEFMLDRRRHILRPVSISKGTNEGDQARISLSKYDERYNSVTGSQQQFPLPGTEPPSWITGVSLIHVNLAEFFTAEMLAFLYSLRGLLRNCHLKLSLLNVQKFTDNALLWSFLRLLNNCCFSLRQGHYSHTELPYMEWPLWAIFNGVLFNQCRQLEIPVELMSSPLNGTDAVRWLLHPSAEKHPRRLKFFSDNSNWQLASRGVAAMLEQIKEEFPQSLDRRIFFVDFPPNGLHHRDWGEWVNCKGEQLVVSQLGIVRLPLGDGHKQFEDFYPHMAEHVQPKIVFNSYMKAPGTWTPRNFSFSGEK